MSNLPGVYETKKKDGTTYFRSSITYLGRHISLGSSDSELTAAKFYKDAQNIFSNPKIIVDSYKSFNFSLSYEKFIILINFRDNKVYFKNPIYLHKKFFIYYLSKNTVLKFDKDDLFFYSNHKIMKRGGYLFVCDYGSQYNILSRYGIKNFAIPNKDYYFVNGDEFDLRYENIKIINQYIGVSKELKNGKDIYLTTIHINGNYIIGRYQSEIEAAIAYNKAADYLTNNGFIKNYTRNYITSISEIEYAKYYTSVRLSKKFRDNFI